MPSPVPDLLTTVPPQLTTPLVRLSPAVSAVRHIVQLVSWQQAWSSSFLVLVAIAAFCLLAEFSAKYLLPLLLLAAYAAAPQHSSSRTPPQLVSEQSLHAIIVDLATIQALLPTLPALPALPLVRLVRACAILYLPYLLLTYLLPLRVIFAVLSSLIITWRAPWAVLIRATLWRSAWVRWSIYHLYSFLTQQPLPQKSLSLHPTAITPAPVNSLRFLFTVYENQRWWMGLDWTAALLPGERPSWSSASQHPVSPPNAFTLPEDTVIYLPGSNGARIKRSASWSWEEPEWRVLVRNEGGPVSRVDRPLPTIKEESTNGSRLLKAAGRLRDSTGASQDKPPSASDQYAPQDPEEPSGEDPSTDADGWVYGDNKWEGQSSRGGMGKYTRYRRWTRVAIVSETVEVVEDGVLGIYRAEPKFSEDSTPPHAEPTDPALSQQSSPLRQRLKMALAKGAVQTQP